MVSYVVGSCSREEEVAFMRHCLDCDACFTTLAMILLLLGSPVGDEEEKALSLLRPVGLKAAEIAREEQKRESRRPSTVDGRDPSIAMESFQHGAPRHVAMEWL